MTTPAEEMPEKRKRQQRKRSCCFCRDYFTPDPRVGSRQVACPRPECQKARKQANQERWLRQRPGYFEGRYDNTKRWLAEHPRYLAEYRRRNPEKVGRDRERRRVRRRCAKEAAADIQDSIALEPPVTKALRPYFPASPGADIQDSILPQVVTASLFSVHHLQRRYTRPDRSAAPSGVSSSTLEAAVPEHRRPWGDDPRRGSHEENASGEAAHRPAARPSPAGGGF